MLRKIYSGVALVAVGLCLASILAVIGQWLLALVGVGIAVFALLYLNALMRQIKRRGP